MGYASGSYNKRWGVPVGLLALILGLVLFGGLTSPLPAYAAFQADCGWCHGVYTNSANANGSDQNVRTDLRDGINAPTYESNLMPQSDNGRGLHGIHMNYSSAAYGGGRQKIPRSSTIISNLPGGMFVNNTAVVASRGTCAFCHDTSNYAHESGFMHWSTTSIQTNKPNTKGFMVYTSPGQGVSYKNNISPFNGTSNGYCTKACHKGTSSTNTSPWGNYTTAAVKLTCNSCHADSNGVSGTEAALSGTHTGHLASAAKVTLLNATTMNSANNGGCKNCHQDSRTEGKTTKDWGQRLGAAAYPHASDGTNVVSDNANLTGQITSPITKNGKGTTCNAACHPRSRLINVAPFNTFINWSSSMNCNMCHYYEATASFSNNSAISIGQLPGAHGLHFQGGVTSCGQCHPTQNDTTHVTSLPVSVTGVTYIAGLGYSGGTNGTCQNTCHTVTSGVWSTTKAAQGCAACHNYPGAAGKDWPTSNGHSIRLSSVYTHLTSTASYNYQTDQYGDVTSKVSKCGKCHLGGTHLNGRVDKNPAPGFGYDPGSQATFAIVSSATYPTMTCTNVVCHSGNPTHNWY